jgi:hypothetical protein
MSGLVDSEVRCATESSDGSHAFVVSIVRPPMPAAPRRWVVATRSILFVTVQIPVSSCRTNVTGLPSRDCAETSPRRSGRRSAGG